MTYQGIDYVDFGHIAAEEEAGNLQRYFIETEEYESVRSDYRKILVIGRKGSGKSAIYVALRDTAAKNKNIVVEALSLQNYPWQIHKKVRDTGVPNEQSYINSWKYITWVLLAKNILGYIHTPTWKIIDTVWWRRTFRSDARYIYRFLKQNYGNIAPSFMEIIADRSREIRSLKVFGVELNTNASSDSFQRLSQSINFINNELQYRVLSLLSNKKEYYLLFDQLDLGWDNTDETKQLMIGLILAARDVVRAAEQRGKRLHFVVFLRSDIYETLRFEDKNKISPDVVELRWDESRLKDLASKRIETSAGGVWEHVFTGETMRQQLSQLSYIVRRTMLRPRDMIQYCVFARSVAMQARKSAVDREDIYNAERPYSDYMRKEIQDETNALPTNIDALFSIIQDIRSMRVPKETFLTICRDKGIEDAEAALELLIELSVLGVYRAGGKERGSTIIYKYQARSWDTLEPSPTLAVHPSLKHALSLVENRSVKKATNGNLEEIEDE